MTESTTAEHPFDEWAPTPPADPGTTQPSVRELLTELAALEGATRGPGAPDAGTGTTDLLAALAREQEIIDELHRRPDGPHTS
jgi:hypothetical protein